MGDELVDKKELEKKTQELINEIDNLYKRHGLRPGEERLLEKAKKLKIKGKIESAHTKIQEADSKIKKRNGYSTPVPNIEGIPGTGGQSKAGPTPHQGGFSLSAFFKFRTCTIENLTPKRIMIEGKDEKKRIMTSNKENKDKGRCLVLSPLEIRKCLVKLSGGVQDPCDELRLKYDLQPYEDWNYIKVEAKQDDSVFNDMIVLIIPFIILGMVVGFFLSFINPLFIPICEIVFPLIVAIIAIIYWAWEKKQFGRLKIGLIHGLSLLAIIIIVIGIPACIIIFFAGGYELWYGETPIIFDFELQAVQIALTTLGLILQFVLILILSYLPAAMYFSYNRERLSTQRDEFIRIIFRFDPNIITKADLDEKYGAKIEEVFGKEEHTGKLLPGTRSPVILATLLITLFWVLALVPSGMDQPATQPGDLYLFLTPRSNALVFAFLGAYTIMLSMLYIRYSRGDLRPKTYTYFMVRMIIAISISWALMQLFAYDETLILGYAFIVGIFPEYGLYSLINQILKPRYNIKESIDKNKGQQDITQGHDEVPSIKPKNPLANLDGIGYYQQSRFFEEGIQEIEDLAYADIIDLMLNTRIPIEELIRWTDQSTLYIHLPTDESDPKVLKEARTILKKYGIQTATELVEAEEGVINEIQGLFNKEPQINKPINPNVSIDLKYQMKSIQNTLDKDAWVANIRYWKNSGDLGRETYTLINPKTGELVDVKLAANLARDKQPET